MAKHQFTILSMMKDEGHSLVEWVAYHKHIGFDNICVYTNNCGDGTDDMLIRLEEMGLVQHFRNEVPEGKKPQPNALNLGQANPEITDSEWVLTMDADEFVSIKCGDGHLKDVIERLPKEVDALAITWRFFGSSGLTDWNPGLVTESYTHAAPDRFRKGWGVKTMFRPREHIKFGIHRPTNKRGKIEQLGEEADILNAWVNGSGEAMPAAFAFKGWRSTGRTLGYNLLELNHYAVKSYEAFLLRRMRGNVNNKEDKYNASYFAIFDRNEEHHPNVQRHTKAVKAAMADILSDPRMAELHAHALAFHAARVEKLRSTDEYRDWIAELGRASAVAITELDEVLFTQHLPKAWQEKIRAWQAEGVPDREIAKLIARSTGVKAEDAEAHEVPVLSIEGGTEISLPDARPQQRGDDRVEKKKAVAQTAQIQKEPKMDTPTPGGRSTHTILSMMKDEGPYLVEWVAYHRRLGFDNICVYTNNCSDGTDAMLARLEEMGLCRHYLNEVPEGNRPQMNALGLATRNPQVTNTDWLLVMDADEFLSIKCGEGRIQDLVAAMEPDAVAMAITWRFFGSSEITSWRPGLVTESYTKAAPDGFRKGWGVKTMFQPYADMKLGIHRPSIKKIRHRPERAQAMLDQIWVNGSGKRMPDDFSLSGWRSTRPTIGYDLAELNHYATKSYEAYLLRRMRGNVNNKEDKYDAAYFSIFDRNEEEHTNVQRHLDGLRKDVAEILKDPDMARLQKEALAFHEARVTALRDAGEYDGWLEDLKAASQVDLDGIKKVVFTHHLPKEWQAKARQMQKDGVPDEDILKMIGEIRTATKSENRAALIAGIEGDNTQEAASEPDTAPGKKPQPARKRAPT